ncbi:conserved hypothetical protein [Beggiatoa sp. PS]|nr:conserved hypothetical protein [Beggiatoa sp. PS]
MNKNSISKPSQTDWTRIKTMTDTEIDLSDIPEITEEQLARSVPRVGLKKFDNSKTAVTVLIDNVVLERLKILSDAQEYQTIINQAIKEYITIHQQQ